MARRLDHRRGHQHHGERLQPLRLREEQGEITSVDTPAGDEAHRGRRRESESLHIYMTLCITKLPGAERMTAGVSVW